MKYVNVKVEDLKVGDIVWDRDPIRVYATKFEVVGFNYQNNRIHLKYIGGFDWDVVRLNDIIDFNITEHNWYREEASND